jgi:hypothetical protein
MTIEILRNALGWSTVINFGVLILWLLFITLARGWTYRLHRRWFKISEEAFDAIHYAGMGLFKIGVWLLNLVPYLALRIVA